MIVTNVLTKPNIVQKRLKQKRSIYAQTITYKQLSHATRRWVGVIYDTANQLAVKQGGQGSPMHLGKYVHL